MWLFRSTVSVTKQAPSYTWYPHISHALNCQDILPYCRTGITTVYNTYSNTVSHQPYENLVLRDEYTASWTTLTIHYTSVIRLTSLPAFLPLRYMLQWDVIFRVTSFTEKKKFHILLKMCFCAYMWEVLTQWKTTRFQWHMMVITHLHIFAERGTKQNVMSSHTLTSTSCIQQNAHLTIVCGHTFYTLRKITD